LRHNDHGYGYGAHGKPFIRRLALGRSQLSRGRLILWSGRARRAGLPEPISISDPPVIILRAPNFFYVQFSVAAKACILSR